MSGTAFVSVHHDPFFSDGVGRQALDMFLNDFTGDAYCVPDSGSFDPETGDVMAPAHEPYGVEKHEIEVLAEAWYADEMQGQDNLYGPGELTAADARMLHNSYERVLFGGGYVSSCLNDAYQSVAYLASDVERPADLLVVPALSFDRLPSGALQGYDLEAVVEIHGSDSIAESRKATLDTIKALYPDRYRQQTKHMDVARTEQLDQPAVPFQAAD